MRHGCQLALNIFNLLVLTILFLFCLNLGFWQLDRANQKKDIFEKIKNAKNENTIHLSEKVHLQQLEVWRQVTATGHWLNEKSILIENRNYNGRPGYWLGTPFLFDENNSIFVLRGWLPRLVSTQTIFLPFNDHEEKNIGLNETITGELIKNIPRLFELPSFQKVRPANSFELGTIKIPKLHNFELLDYAKAADINLLPIILRQTDNDNSSLVRDWPNPPVNFEKNIGYAIQWFIFSAFCCIGWIAVLLKFLFPLKSANQSIENKF